MQIVHPYSIEFLTTQLTLKPSLKSEIIIKKHVKYLHGYFTHEDINAKTIVFEDKYVSKDYLYDYTEYYSTIFENYERFCKRLHFFSNVFTQEEFETILLNNEGSGISSFWDNYLGFIVIKPLPINNIGISVLRHFKEPRRFWGIRNYTINIFGCETNIESLAFQEQDKVVSACATTALWCMLQKASKEEFATSKSPSELTKDAGLLSPEGGRLFPNKGLNLFQMCQVIVKAGLVTEVRKGDINIKIGNRTSIEIISNEYLKKLVYGYSFIGIPIILVIKVPSKDETGLHAITVCGHNLRPTDLNFHKKKYHWFSDSLDKLYAHDDQFGPFAKIEFNENTDLITPWNEEKRTHKIYVKNIIIPVYHKIRITYDNIEVTVIRLHEIFARYFKPNFMKYIQWEIKANYSEKYKQAIKSNTTVNSQLKLKILTQSLPKYIWIATMYLIDYPLCEFVFDATNIESGIIGLERLCFDDEIKSSLNKFININPDLIEILQRNFRNFETPPFFN